MLQLNSVPQQHCFTLAPTCQSYHRTFFHSLPQKSKLLKSNTGTVISASDTDLRLTGQCYQHQYVIYNNAKLCASILSTITKPIVWNAGALYLQLRGILIITLQAPTEIKPQYIYDLSTSIDLTSDFIPLAVDHKINQNYTKLLSIPILNMAHSRVYIPKSTIFGTLKPAAIENAEISETSWTKIESLNRSTMENIEEIHQHSQNNNELPTLLLHLCF